MRYLGEEKGRLKEQDYKNLKEKHGKKEAIIYRTIDFGGLRNVRISVREYGAWSVGSNLRKIAQDAYGDASLWWTIGVVNSKPTDAHFSIGDVIMIPTSPTVLKNSIG
jgi:hypothetical protein